ncbi:amino acid adenylation domain-containing protein [Archangium violaceum]|uniref:non-ribosomal peptide synthetase n=1 Tax=Archangium violaceum TaxID=83451 RepID=UPI001951C474|nr:amino acid adenylation domain-containing protein [Archangium violaceum]QRO00996.1 amino acid adenylation domain-containing protein [Archangium violaceum]
MRRTETALDTPPGSDAADGERLPLSFAQQRMWLLHHYAPDVPLYNSPIAFRIRGSLSAPVLERGLRLLAERHEGMRTTFPTVDGMPQVAISDEVSFHLPVEDLQHLPPAAREEAALERATTEARRVFDMGQGPLWRALLLRLTPEEHLFVLTMHHIITDGWSMGLLCEELSRTYEALWKGTEPVLPELPLQYADFAAWQREWLSGDTLAAQLKYWKESLAGAPPVMELPTDRPRPAKNTYRAARHAFVLPASLTKPLEALSAKEGSTPFMILLSTFSALLGRYTRRDDIIVGTPIANRNRAEIERLVGFFVNTLVLRVRLDGNPSFRELLQRVRQVTLGAYDHQDLPFEKLVEELSPERNQSHSPIFQVLFDFATADLSLRLPGLEASHVRLDEGSTPFDVSVSLEKSGDSYGGYFTYNADLFESTTIARLERHYARLLGAALAQPERPVGDLPLLEADEEHRLLVDWNRTAFEPRADSTLHHLFERQVEATPEALALVVGTRRFTYRQLDERANQLAWHLRSLGVGPEVPVAVCLERTETLLVAILAVLKAGGAYVPLDPAYPSQRLAFSLADARSPLLLTQHSLAESMRGLGAPALLTLDEPEAFSHHPTHRPACPAESQHLAYVLYTSGSTGRPKGVAVQHASAAALVQWALNAFSTEQLSATLAATSVCFDLSIFELFAPLSCGGRVYLADNALALPSLPAASEVTLINTVPSAVTELVRQGALPASVRTVNLAGEPLPASLVQSLYGLGTVQSVYNLYGPTEDTTYSTWALAPRESSAPPPIGRPLPGTQAYVLDARLRPVPQGIPGELYLGGKGLARGYLGRPDLSAERFVPNPFSSTPGARMYRTGDRVRWRADGQLEYLERIDFQVKVRGFRIELGEVEQALLQHPAVREAVALARDGGPDGKQLVAYVTGPADQLGASALRSFLRERLPDYMVPSAFVVLEALPLTANGKVDRQALPAPVPSAGASRIHIPHRDRTEMLLCGIWEELLNVHPIGIRDDFFALGGTSLVAVRLMHRIRETFGRTLPISALFSAKSVEELALLLREKQDPVAWTPLVPIQPGGKRRPLYCVHPLGGTVLGFGPLARRLGPDQPFFGLEHVRPGKPPNRVEAMAAEYLAAIRKHQPQGSYRLAGKSVGGLVAVEMARMLQAEGQEVELLALLGTAVPMDDRPGPNAESIQAMAHLSKEDALVAKILLQFGQEFPELQELARMSKEEKLSKGLRFAKEHGALPADFGESQLDHLFWAWHAEAEAFDIYRAQYYDGHITHFVPACDEGKPVMDWSGLCRSWEVHVVAGEHETIDDEPHVEVLANALGGCLRRLDGVKP